MGHVWCLVTGYAECIAGHMLDCLYHTVMVQIGNTYLQSRIWRKIGAYLDGGRIIFRLEELRHIAHLSSVISHALDMVRKVSKYRAAAKSHNLPPYVVQSFNCLRTD